MKSDVFSDHWCFHLLLFIISTTSMLGNFLPCFSVQKPMIHYPKWNPSETVFGEFQRKRSHHCTVWWGFLPHPLGFCWRNVPVNRMFCESPLVTDWNPEREENRTSTVFPKAKAKKNWSTWVPVRREKKRQLHTEAAPKHHSSWLLEIQKKTLSVRQDPWQLPFSPPPWKFTRRPI